MKYDLTEKDAQVLNTGRLLRAESDVMLPMLAERREQVITKLLMHYRGGAMDKVRDCVAELCVTDDMQKTIKNKIRAADAVERKVLDGSTDSNE